MGPDKRDLKGVAMLAFLKSELFLRFFGGFVIGAIGVFALQPHEQSVLSSPAIASTASPSATSGGHAAL